MGLLADILNGKKINASSIDLGKQYLDLEKQIPVLEAAIKAAEQKAKTLRQSRLAGESVSSSDVERADVALRNAELDLSAAVDTMATVRDSIGSAICIEDEDAEQKAFALRDKAEEVKDIEREEYLKAAANYKAFYGRFRSFLSDDSVVEGDRFANHEAFKLSKLFETRSAELEKKYGPGLKKAAENLNNVVSQKRDRNIKQSIDDLLNRIRNAS